MSLHYSMLESAEDYAREWLTKNNTAYAHVMSYSPAFTLGILTGGVIPCTCIGGLPMIKSDCPKHGHLARSGEERSDKHNDNDNTRISEVNTGREAD